MNITDKLDEFDALAAAATKGPWDSTGLGSTGVGAGDLWIAHVVDHSAGESDPSQAKVDATFIADARTTVPALVKALRGAVDPDLVESAEWLGEMRTFTGEHAEDPGNRAYMAYIERVLTAAGAVQRDGFRWGPICLAIILDRHVRETEKAIAIETALGGAA